MISSARRRISSEALFVKVMATISLGGVFFDRRWTRRATKVFVFPEPAPAVIKSAPSGAVAASSCLGFSSCGKIISITTILSKPGIFATISAVIGAIVIVPAIASGLGVLNTAEGMAVNNRAADPAVLQADAFDLYKPIFGDKMNDAVNLVFTDQNQFIVGNSGFVAKGIACDTKLKNYFGGAPTKGNCRSVPNEGKAMEFAGSCGAEAYAASEALVNTVDNNAGKIEVSTIENSGVSTHLTYYSLSDIKVKEGDIIKSGNTIGKAGTLSDGTCGVGMKW